MRFPKFAALCAAGAALALSGSPSLAASHSDAPLIKLDPQANITDVYSFIRVVGGVKVLNVIVNCRPFSNPGDGVMYERFSPSDDARYSIHITDPKTGEGRCRYDFQFSAVQPPKGYKNLDTILSYGLGTEAGPILSTNDARQNYTQHYIVTKVAGSKSTRLLNVTGDALLVPPPNVGPRTTPFYNDTDTSSPTYGQAISGATSPSGLDKYTREAIYFLSSGESVFCGSRDDSFYADTGAIFDLLNPRILKSLGDLGGGDGCGVDDFKGYNVLTYSIRIPVSQLPGVDASNPLIGVYASVSRPAVTIRSNAGDRGDGGWVQVNRMGNPLFNEVLVALRDKDNYNRDKPTNDATKYSKYATNVELAFLVNFVYGDALMSAFGRKLKETGRTDIAGIYTPDVLKVDTSTGAVPVAGEAAFNRLSFLGGDTTDGAPSGWPNGRRVGDDVIDIALLAIANDDLGNQTLIALNDNVAGNDVAYHTVFPYVATPHSGFFIRHDPAPCLDGTSSGGK